MTVPCAWFQAVSDPKLRALTEAALDSAARAALQIAKSRAGLLEELRGALLRNDIRRVLMLARRLTGLEEEAAPDVH